MFSPATKRQNPSRRKDRIQQQTPVDSPSTPLAENRSFRQDNAPVPDRPSTGTPAPWAPRLSVLARIPTASKSDRGDDVDPIKPVFVGEFPQAVRDEQTSILSKRVPGDVCVLGGMDKGTCLSWIICRDRLFVWDYLSSAASNKCIVLELPSNVQENGDISRGFYHSNCWMLSVVNWDGSARQTSKGIQRCISAGIVLCNQKTRAVVYWPNISVGVTTPVTSLASTNEQELTSSPLDGKTTPNSQRQGSKARSSFVGLSSFNSLIASAVPDAQMTCVALTCSSNGELWQFYCSPTGIHRKKVCHDIPSVSSQGNDSGQLAGGKGYPRSLIWAFSGFPMQEPNRQFFLLTDHELQCFNVKLCPDSKVSKLWSYEIVGTDGDLGIKKDLAGQKRIWPLDVQVDDHGKEITILVATFCKDRSFREKSSHPSDNPKARVEDEDFLFSMRLRVGGKPSGSAVILSGDGTATVSHYYRNSTRLYQFDLPYDAGKVLDASVLPSTDDGDDGAWVVLTEKAGVWAIPEKAVVLGGVQPPERSLSRKGSSNEGSVQEERRNLMFAGNIAPRKVSSDTWDVGDRQKASLTGVSRRTAQDEESEALLGHIFHGFLLSGQVASAFEKLQNSGAFERDGETSVFARTSKSIVDTLAKHWTTTRGAEILSMVSTQLVDKQQKHNRFLQFLALSKCHEELCSRQRHSLQIILEHGEKLAGMIQLRELQNMISQNRSTGVGSPHSRSDIQISGALWDLIQLVGERARRNTVLLMDRDNAEVFYSKVSDLEEVFYCLDRQLQYIVSVEQPYGIQIQRSCELSKACVSIVRTAMHYKNDHYMWYPPPEGLTPWYSQPMVRNGMWNIASFMLQLLNETPGHMSAKSDLYGHLEALAEVLLETYTGAITARVERGEEHRGLLNEYCNRRDALLDILYKQVKGSVLAHQQDISEAVESKNEEILRKLSSSLLSIAKRHEGYRIMWEICCDLDDSELLRNLMHESMGPKGGFCQFVFKQLYEKRQFSELLRLGEEFQEELSIFLKHHQDLLWLHEVFLHQFTSASETLHMLALSGEEDSISAVEDGEDTYNVNPEPTLADRKRLLNLAKIAAMAGRDADSETKVKRIEADTKILKLQVLRVVSAYLIHQLNSFAVSPNCFLDLLQEEIMNVLPADEVKQYVGGFLLRPEELIELCLKSDSAELALRAFDVFAWTSSSFRTSHRNLLEECWKNAANQDDWGQLYQASVTEGWSDEETLQQLRDTVLFQTSSRCYGPNAETIDEGFEEVLPLRQENLEAQVSKDLSSSVEAILMQHKDFPYAGKLMLTALVLGSEQDDTANAARDDSPTPME
ncbi:hypothetical protein JRO89_XS01G0121100 [Xanthoceras sorbifolium]|uniref:Nucleoporin Nup133/Nup155-like N-terminal domain-containing protein n=1 Tax=Xanthoceras sorbifolium TaxID=99658 RepID=A0ABQ8IIY4_9ROSI|nr:hypothetical protein JRO89_XS01G0121100 [Xanthoceras sorbifolium]